MCVCVCVCWGEYLFLRNGSSNSSCLNIFDTLARFLDLHLLILDGFVSSKFYDKHDDFDFDIVNVPYLHGDVRPTTSYDVDIS